MSQPDMLQYFDQLEKESKALKEEVLKLCWYMRGSISYDEGMTLSQEDRTLMSKSSKIISRQQKSQGYHSFKTNFVSLLISLSLINLFFNDMFLDVSSRSHGHSLPRAGKKVNCFI
jgi:hypothetical protein